MPDVKVYIRAENIEKWNSIASKSVWINTILKNADSTSEWGATKQTPVGPVVTVLSESVPEEPLSDFDKFLKDYSEVGVRKPPHPKYGYPCCHREPPCKHWEAFDDGVAKNSLTGDLKVKETL